ncbi:MAG TPA: hypothetical protein VMN78_13290 [Longimicrobiales bacterium]|nr:hypothetical protein [Longimicrobiales bacterium]
MRRLISLLTVPLALAGTACGDPIDPVIGGEGGGTTGFAVILTDDPTNDPGLSGSRASQGPLAITGEMDGSVRVSLRNDANGLVDLGVDQDVVLPLQQGSDSLRLQNLSRPPTDTYVAIQLRFEGVTVLVRDGSEVGDTVLTEDVRLDVGNGLATVEIATLPFDISGETELVLVVDLNSEAWITRANLDAGTVPQADLSNNVTIEIP